MSGRPVADIDHRIVAAAELVHGNLQYTAMWKVTQRKTKRPVKFGTILPELLAASVADEYYKDPVERTWGGKKERPKYPEKSLPDNNS